MERGGLGRKELLARRYCFACAVVSRPVLPQQSGGERKLEERGKEMREEEKSEGYGAVERRAWRCTNLLALFPGSRYDVRVRPKLCPTARGTKGACVCVMYCLYIYILCCTVLKLLVFCNPQHSHAQPPSLSVPLAAFLLLSSTHPSSLLLTTQ